MPKDSQRREWRWDEEVGFGAGPAEQDGHSVVEDRFLPSVGHLFLEEDVFLPSVGRQKSSLLYDFQDGTTGDLLEDDHFVERNDRLRGDPPSSSPFNAASVLFNNQPPLLPPQLFRNDDVQSAGIQDERLDAGGLHSSAARDTADQRTTPNSAGDSSASPRQFQFFQFFKAPQNKRLGDIPENAPVVKRLGDHAEGENLPRGWRTGVIPTDEATRSSIVAGRGGAGGTAPTLQRGSTSRSGPHGAREETNGAGGPSTGVLVPPGFTTRGSGEDKRAGVPSSTVVRSVPRRMQLSRANYKIDVPATIPENKCLNGRQSESFLCDEKAESLTVGTCYQAMD